MTRLCKCGTRVDDNHLARCPNCGVELPPGAKFCNASMCSSLVVAEGKCAVHRPKPGSKLYKVITQRDEFFGGKFEPAKLERVINDLSADGWRVVSVASADVSTFWGAFWSGRSARQEMVIFMERTVEA